MKLIYRFDEDGCYIDQYLVDDLYKPAEFETDVKPDEGLLLPYHWQEGKWVSATADEATAYMQKYINPTTSTPDKNQLMLNQVISMLAAQQADISLIKSQIEKENK